ncbi:MAG: hypothetical protein IKP97_00505 [Kiritimatiellae bacterium]|nr:hypothetical protein [Kiritimatiellia bacterium]
MKRWMVLWAACLAASAVLAGWETLTSTRLDPSRMTEEVGTDILDMWCPANAFLPECTEFTLLKMWRSITTDDYAHFAETDTRSNYAIFASGHVSVEPARATAEGGPALEEEQPWDYDTPLTLNASGQFSYANALPANISWDHWGEYPDEAPTVLCINIETDSDLTLMIGAEEFEIEAAAGRQRLNVELTTGSRSVSVAASDPAATVKLGWATLPWIRFYDCGTIPNDPYGDFTAYMEYFNPGKPYVMFAIRGKIENGTLTTQMGFLSVTNEMWQTAITESVDANRFAKDSRVRVTRMVPGSFAAEYNGAKAWLGVAGYGQKLVDSWLTDAQIRRIADLDFKELHRRGATFPGVSNDYWEQIQ